MAFGLTKKEVSWVLYDVGNSAFVMLSTALIPVYFASLAEEGSFVVVAWGYAETVASLILALLMPLLGSLADLAGNKKKFLVGFAGTGAVACAALGVPQHALAFLVVYVIAAIMLNGSMVFYDAFLIDATTGIFAWVRVGLYWFVHSLHSLFGGCARWSFLWFGYGHWYEGCVCHYGAVVDSFYHSSC